MWQSWHHSDVEEIRQADRTFGVVYYYFFQKRDIILKFLSLGDIDFRNKSDDRSDLEAECIRNFESFIQAKDWQIFYYPTADSQGPKARTESDMLADILDNDPWWEIISSDDPAQ